MSSLTYSKHAKIQGDILYKKHTDIAKTIHWACHFQSGDLGSYIRGRFNVLIVVSYSKTFQNSKVEHI